MKLNAYRGRLDSVDYDGEAKNIWELIALGIEKTKQADEKRGTDTCLKTIEEKK